MPFCDRGARRVRFGEKMLAQHSKKDSQNQSMLIEAIDSECFLMIGLIKNGGIQTLFAKSDSVFAC